MYITPHSDNLALVILNAKLKFWFSANTIRNFTYVLVNLRKYFKSSVSIKSMLDKETF